MVSTLLTKPCVLNLLLKDFEIYVDLLLQSLTQAIICNILT